MITKLQICADYQQLSFKIKNAPDPGGKGAFLKNNFKMLKFGASWVAWERNYITDIGHTSHK
jgi:hypothetical protein